MEFNSYNEDSIHMSSTDILGTKSSNKKTKIDEPSLEECKQTFELGYSAGVDYNGNPKRKYRIITLLPTFPYVDLGILRNRFGSSSFNGTTPTATVDTLFNAILWLQQQTPHIRAIATVVGEVLKEDLDRLEALMKEGKIAFDLLRHKYVQDLMVYWKQHGEPMAGRISNVGYNQSFVGTNFYANVEYMKCIGSKFVWITGNAKINEFEGEILIADLPIHPLTEEEKTSLIARGKTYSKLAISVNHLQCNGKQMVTSMWGHKEYHEARGRCMVDAVGYAVESHEDERYSNSKSVDADTITEEHHLMMDGWISGYSIRLKQWGQFRIIDLEPIVFDEHAYQYLVMDQTNKNFIRKLVENTGVEVTDLVSKKGGGCIFLLYGPPGTGKTLTAESISEHLKRPLLSISGGELGTTSNNVEEKLEHQLSLARRWGGILLIDEADVFLETRTANDINRNAIVAVFLRHLEYYSGILFLTSNRFENMDTAFKSRITVRLQYAALDRKARKEVICNLLTVSGLVGGEKDVADLAACRMNGREIKSVVHSVQRIAASVGGFDLAF